MIKTSSLQWCCRCDEASVRIKSYVTKAGDSKRVMLCMNKGCGFKVDLPTMPEGYGE